MVVIGGSSLQKVLFWPASYFRAEIWGGVEDGVLLLVVVVFKTAPPPPPLKLAPGIQITHNAETGSGGKERTVSASPSLSLSIGSKTVRISSCHVSYRQSWSVLHCSYHMSHRNSLGQSFTVPVTCRRTVLISPLLFLSRVVEESWSVPHCSCHVFVVSLT